MNMNAPAKHAPGGGAGAPPTPPMLAAAAPKAGRKDEPARDDNAEAKVLDQRMKFDDAFKRMPHAAEAKPMDRLREK